MSSTPFSLNLSDFGGSIYDTAAPPPPPAAMAPPVVTGPTSGISAFENAISGLSSVAAPWFTAATGRSVIQQPTSFSQAALQQTRLQQEQQSNLAQGAPGLAAVLANPTVILVGVAIFGLLFYLVSKK